MKIILYSHFFSPSVGGLEIVSEALATLFTSLGNECIVVTNTKNKSEHKFPFQVVRNPDFNTKKRLTVWADIILSNGASMELLWTSILFRKPFVWVHAGYQATCIDGLGWVEGEPAPLNPWKSILYHFKRFGFKKALSGGLKLYVRRIASQFFVAKNIAITDWVYNRQPFKNQIRIYNPFPLPSITYHHNQIIFEYDFLFCWSVSQ